MTSPATGVYALTHEERGLVYIGSSRDLERRHRQWRYILASIQRFRGWRRQTHVTDDFWTQARDTRARDWEFEILRWFEPQVSDKELIASEMKAIAFMKSLCGDRCLNVQTLCRETR